MLKTRLQAVDAVQSTLVPAEQAADHAALECARSIVAMLQARQAANLPLVLGLDPLGRASRALTLLIDGRRELIEAHPELEGVARQIGLKPSMFGKEDPTMAELTQESEVSQA